MLKYRIKNLADVKKGILWLHDIIGVDDNTSAEVARALNEMESNGVKKFTVHINSPGGLVFDGLAIYNMLAERDAEIIVDGVAASIASVIACAGKSVKMYKNAFFMIHNPWTFNAGDANYMRKLADQMDQVKASIMQAYEDHTGLSADALTEFMDQTTWFNAEQSLNYGFATEIIDSKSAVDTAKLKNQIINLIQGDDPMRDILIKMLNLDKNATDKDIENALTALKANADQVDDLVGQVAELQSKIDSGAGSGSGDIAQLTQAITGLQNTVNQLQADARKKEAEGLVSRAISDGKIFPAQKDVYLAQAEKDPQAFAATLKDMPQLFDPKHTFDLDTPPAEPVSQVDKFKNAMRQKALA